MGEEKSDIEKYLEAVSERKSINRRGRSPQVNYAIVTQLEEKDIPLLIEMLRVQSRALEAVIDLATDIEEGSAQLTTRAAHEEMGIVCALAYSKSSELATMGSKARWGGFQGNVH